MMSEPTEDERSKWESSNKKSKSWLVTTFSDDMVEKIKLWEGLTRRLIVQETCPTTGRSHFHCVLTFKNTLAWGSFKKLVGNNNFYAVGYVDGCSNYCMKADSVILVNERTGRPGHRSDKDKAYEAAESKMTERSFKLQERPTYVGLKMFREVAAAVCPVPTTRPIEVLWFYGPTGCGKSYTAFSYPDFYRVPPGKWFSGYDGQKTIILDEFRDNKDWNCSFHYLLMLMDVYPLQVETKGGHTWLRHDTLIVTCPEHPEALYANYGEDVRQLMRRIGNGLRYFGTPYSEGGLLAPEAESV